VKVPDLSAEGTRQRHAAEDRRRALADHVIALNRRERFLNGKIRRQPQGTNAHGRTVQEIVRLRRLQAELRLAAEGTIPRAKHPLTGEPREQRAIHALNQLAQ
jgi:hypothetical protein